MENLYCLLFVIAKFEIFKQNYLIVSDSINNCYRNKMFLERASITEKAFVYNPKHPVTLKSYRMSLFN